MTMPIAVQVLGTDNRRILVMIDVIKFIEDMGNDTTKIYCTGNTIDVLEPYDSLYERIFEEKPHAIDSGDSGRDNAQDSSG
jgi:hypothetical protein